MVQTVLWFCEGRSAMSREGAHAGCSMCRGQLTWAGKAAAGSGLIRVRPFVWPRVVIPSRAKAVPIPGTEWVGGSRDDAQQQLPL